MNRCGDCKHWGDARERSRGCVYRRCAMIVHQAVLESIGAYSSVMSSHGFLAGTGDDDWTDCFYSRADFGCVLFEPESEDRS